MPERKSNNYKVLLYILPLGFALIVLAIVASRLTNEHPMCQTQVCISAAHEIISSIDPKVDPCEDFFTFACGNAIQRGRERKLVKIKQEIKNDLDILMESRVGADDHFLVKRQKNLFQVCINETGSEEESLDAFKILLSNLRGWPVLVGEHWDGNSFEWISFSYKLRAYGLLYVSFLDFGVDPDPANGSRYILHVKEPFVIAPEEEHKTPYVNFMMASVITLGADRVLAKKEMWEVYEFTMKLYHVTTENDWDTTDDINYSRQTVKDFQAKNNRTDWLKLIRKIVQVVDLGEEDQVLFPKPKFVNALFNLLDSTPKRVQANYLFWNLYESLVHYFPQRFRQLEQNYNCQSAPSTVPKTRLDFCRRLVQLSFDVIPTDMLYAKQKVTGELKSSVEEMVKNIKLEIISLLQNSGWMDELSVDMAVRKVNAIESVIGPSEVFVNHNNNTTLRVNEDSGCLLNAYLENRRALTDAMYARINAFTYNHELDKLANSVNAAYLPELNKIVLHAGILHEGIFHPDQMSYCNYGMLGSIIGHELTHAISDGNVWTNKTQNSYKRLVNCLLDQGDNFNIQGTTFKMNGTLTLEENIADTVGVKASFNAYRTWVMKNGNEQRLVGLDYTPDQLFWISAMSQYCYKLSDKQLGQVLQRDNHALNIFRAVNPLRNNKDFASAFRCPVGSKMHPNVQCKVFG